MGKNNKLKKLRENFPDKQINRLVSCRLECPLTFHQRLVLSFIIYRCRKDGKAVATSVNNLMNLSGIHRDTISKSLKVLEKYKLVVCRQQKWQSLKEGREQHPEWFGWRNGGRDIKDLSYHYFLQPSTDSPLTIIDSLVFVSDSKKVGLLAARFQTSENTVRKSIRKIDGQTIPPEWFADILHKPKAIRPNSNSAFLSGYSGVELSLAKKMLIQKWTQADVEIFFRAVKDKFNGENYDNTIYRLIDCGVNSFDSIMRIHREKGNDGSNGLGLVLFRLGIQKPA